MNTFIHGHATVEVLESHPHPAYGPVVEDGPYGMKWQRVEIRSLGRSKWGNYVVTFCLNGASGAYPEGNIRPAQH